MLAAQCAVAFFLAPIAAIITVLLLVLGGVALRPGLMRARLEGGYLAEANLSLLKSGKVKGVRFSTLEKICAVLECQPGELLEFRPDA